MSDPRTRDTTQAVLPGCPFLREREQRLASLKRLAGQLAHDFNNFMAPLQGYTTLIKEEAPAGSAIAGYAATLENAARKTGAIVQRIAEATRLPKHPQHAPVDLAVVVREELRAWQEGLPATAAITVHSSLERCELSADEGQWRRAVQELLGNARYALALGGQLEVTLRVQELEAGRAAELGVRAGQVARLSFQDNGLGMTAETPRRAFEPFFTTRPRALAAGLGLSLVHTVVGAHRGQVELESEADQGTCVTIWLPMAAAEGAVREGSFPPEQASALATGRQPGRKVLLIEADPWVMEVTKGRLQEAQCEVLTARGAPDGLKLYRRHATDLRLVIMAASLAGAPSAELIQEMRKVKPGLPVLVLATGAEQPLAEPFREPSLRLIGKPIKVRDLVALVLETTR